MLALAACCACRGPAPAFPLPRLAHSEVRAPAEEPWGESSADARSWVSASFGGLARRKERVDLGTGAALALDLGMDVASGPLVPAVELSLGVSRHSNQDEGFPGVSSVDLGRVALGGRLSLAPHTSRIVPHVRGGYFLRWNFRSYPADVEPSLDDDGEGFYYGAGIDFGRPGRQTWGLYFVAYEDELSGLQERFFGLGGTVRYR